MSSGPFRFAFEPVPEYSNRPVSKTLCPYLPVVDHDIPASPSGWTEFRFPLESDCEEGIAEALSKLDSTLILFVAGRGLPLRRILVPGRAIELADELSGTGGIVSIVENASPKQWFYARHSFVINEDREAALTDFANATGKDILKTPFREEIVVAVPLTLGENGVLSPNTEHRGRFHSFMPTLDEYEWHWDINANFLLDEQRDHLRPPDKGSWNAALLEECGQALLCLLNEVNDAWRKDPGLPVALYYNVVPAWDEAVDAAQVGRNFAVMQTSFSLHFGDKHRTLVQTGKGLALDAVSQTIWIERRLFPLFPANVWSRLVPEDSHVASLELDEEIWKPILCANCAVPLFDGSTLAMQLVEKDWPDRLGIELNPGDMVSLVGRLCCYLGDQGITADEVREVRLILDSNRELRRPIDKPNGKAICRMLDDELTGLPEYVSRDIVLVHDGVMRFLQRDPSYFKGAFSEGLTDGLRSSGRELWTSLTGTLDIGTVIRTWLNPTFDQQYDSDPSLSDRRFDWLRFLFENRDRVQRKGLLKELRVRLLARVGPEEMWKQAQEIWLFGACPQGRDIETFIGDTPGVPLLSRKHAEALVGGSESDGATLGTFFSRLGVRSSIESVPQYLGSFSPWSEDGRKKFCSTLGIDFDRMPSGNINQLMMVQDYDFHSAIISAFNDAIAQSGNFVHRTERLRSFVKLLENSWPELRNGIKKKGFCHFYGAQVDTVVPGSPSTLANRLRNTEWVPLANDARTLKQPCETCHLNETNLQLADLSAIGNYADLYFENGDLVTFLGFAEMPQGLTALDAIRSLTRNWSNLENPKVDFDKLYGNLATELGSKIDLETARMAFQNEALLFLPTKPPILRRSNEVLCGADSRFEGFLEDLSDFYPPALQALFKRLGVATQVEEIHYLRYLVAYVWKERPSIDERRRSTILKSYRQLANWAKAIPAGQGVWTLNEGKAFNESLLFYGRCQGDLGWYSGHDKTIVFRDEPQLEAALADSDKYVLRPF